VAQQQGQQGGGQQQQGGQQQGRGQQQPGPAQLMGRALANIRRVQNLLELNYPNQTEAIQMQREAGDAVWAVMQSLQQDGENTR
jgi:hypothetical protein